jgi:hypothetical protein
MTDREKVHEILKALKFPLGQYVIGGSGSMVLHGIEREMRDLDIFVSTALWFTLYESTTLTWGLVLPDPEDDATKADPPILTVEFLELPIEVYFHYRRRSIGDIDTAFWLKNYTLQDGWPCVPLEMIFQWKDQLGRAKDARDMELIRRHLAQKEE